MLVCEKQSKRLILLSCTEEGISYMLAQFIGAILGAFTLKLCLPPEALKHPFVTLGSLSVSFPCRQQVAPMHVSPELSGTTCD